MQLKQDNPDYKLYDLDYYTVKHREGLVTSTLKHNYASILNDPQTSYQYRDNTHYETPQEQDASLLDSEPTTQRTEEPIEHIHMQTPPRPRVEVPQDIGWENCQKDCPTTESPQASKVTADTKNSEITLSTVMSHVTNLQAELQTIMKQCAATQNKYLNKTL